MVPPRTIRRAAFGRTALIIVFFDVEYTAWEGSLQRKWSEPWEFREIVQIGAAKVKLPDGEDTPDVFQQAVRPTLNPILSDYFVQLTGIRQQDVDRHGLDLSPAIDAFLAFCQGADSACSNGDDAVIMAANLDRLGLPARPALYGFPDIGKLISQTLDSDGRHITTSDLPARLGLDIRERPHQALGDAKALAASVQALFGRDPVFRGRLEAILRPTEPGVP